jgi:hypothetical protein
VISLLGAATFAGAGVAGAASAEPAALPWSEVAAPSVSAIDSPSAENGSPENEAGAAVAPAPLADATGDITHGKLWADFDAWQVSLTDGQKLHNPRGNLLDVAPNVSGTQRGAFHLDNTAEYLDMDGTVAYKIAMPNQPTDYWIAPRLYTAGNAPEAECPIYLGKPGAGGVPARSPIPFTCSTEKTQNAPNMRYTFHVGLNRWAASSGTVKTDGHVSLQDGSYNSEQTPYHTDGTKTVGTNSSTDFSVVVREGDKTLFPNQARMDFSYRIVLDGAPQNMWLAGWVDNHRWPTEFESDAQCFVSTVNPNAPSAPPLEKLDRVAASMFDCAITGDFVHGPHEDGNGHYAATFTVSKRQMATVTSIGEQKQLMDRWCGSSATCGFNNSTVTPVLGKEIRVTDIEANSSSKKPELWETSTEGTEEVSVSNGFEIGIESEEGWILDTFTASFKYNFNKTVTKSTKTGEKTTIEIPYGKEAWKVGSPDMQRVTGSVVVHDTDTDTWYDLESVNTDIPDKDGQWHFDVRMRDIATDEDPDAAPGVPDATDTPVTDDASLTAGAGHANALAHTGSTIPVLPIGIAAGAALLAGIAAVLLRRRMVARHQSNSDS